MTADLLAGLNEAQRRAVTYRGGPLLVAAGPGSGKTRVISHRIAHLVQSGTPPERLLAITFTNRAAREMERRVRGLLGEEVRVPIGTFHWAGSAILRRHAHRLGVSRDFSLIDPGEARRLLRSAAHPFLAPAISALKHGRPLEQVAREAGVPPEVLQSQLAAYEQQLRRRGVLDLDDLLALTARLLRQFPEMRQQYRSWLAEVLVDEYQDTNPVQRELVRLLQPESNSVVVVGDEDQAIYGWREADARAVEYFLRDFSPEVIKLEQSYRSSKRILRAAGSLIARNTHRLEKTMTSSRPAGPLPVSLVAVDELEESELVVQTIERLRREEGYTLSEMAVLYRVNAQSRAIEDALVRQGFPYQVVAGQRFYQRPEIRRVLAYLQLALDRTHPAAAFLLEQIPGFGPRRIVRIQEEAEAGGVPLLDAAARLPRGVPARGRQLLDSVRQTIEQLAGQRDRPLVELVEAAVAAVEAELAKQSPAEAESRRENLAELRSALREFARPGATLRDFLDRLSLGAEGPESGEGVRLMTIHAAKGLEFPVVFLAGLEEGLLPHHRALSREKDIEEERRLCYVGMTRAMDHLYLSHTHLRLLGGSAITGSPSRFLGEIGARHLDVRPGRRASQRPRLSAVAAGERVIHGRWGEGVVTRVEGRGRDTMVTIEFDSAGRQRLQLCYAPLSRSADVAAG